MLAALTHSFGLQNLDLADEVVQEALLQALHQWRLHGLPDNPQGWLLRAARDKARICSVARPHSAAGNTNSASG
jgi:RNA polymerase sigma-70 factor (ECF subfamily)